jgi:hypothetical protein
MYRGLATVSSGRTGAGEASLAKRGQRRDRSRRTEGTRRFADRPDKIRRRDIAFPAFRWPA